MRYQDTKISLFPVGAKQAFHLLRPLPARLPKRAKHDKTVLSPLRKLLSFAKLMMFIAVILILPSQTCFAEGVAEPVCIQCHSKLPEKYSKPVELWRGSIHAENGIFCNGCHGGDPKDAAVAMDPAHGFLGVPKETAIPAFCGRCHVGVMKDYLKSAHGRMLGKGGPTCVTCHSNHHVVKATLDLISEKNCSRCHSFERAGLIQGAMKETETMIISIDGRIGSLKKIGADTDKLEKELFAARNSFHSMFHNVNVELFKKESAQITADLKKIKAALDRKDAANQKRKIAGVAVVLFLLLIAVVLHLFKKTYD